MSGSKLARMSSTQYCFPLVSRTVNGTNLCRGASSHFRLCVSAPWILLFGPMQLQSRLWLGRATEALSELDFKRQLQLARRAPSGCIRTHSRRNDAEV